MDYKELRETAKKRLTPKCRVCPVCNGKACAGEVPGMGGAGTGRAFMANVEALAAVRLNLRALHGHTEPDLSFNCFGRAFQTPIQAAPMTGVSYNMGGDMTEADFIACVIKGCREAGTLGWSGDGADPAMYDSGLAAVKDCGGLGLPVIKPRGQEEIIERIRRAEDAGAVAVGMDVDGAGLITMAQFGQPVGPKTEDQLVELVASTRLPFVLKGVMTKDEAKAAAKAGCAAIVVSNHGGRVLDHTPGVAEVLPGIAKKTKGKLTVFADGGVRSGSDVLKLLALGADGVLVGRPLIMAAFGGGAEGVAFVLNKLRTELLQAMLLTGVESVSAVHEEVVFDS